MKKLKNILSKILILLFVITLNSCGIFQKVFKSSNKNKDNVEIKINKEQIINSIDSSKITTTEVIDSNLVIKGNKYQSTNKLNDLTNIKNLLLINNDLISISQSYDSISKTLKTDVILKDQVHIIKVNKTTIKQNNIKLNSNLKLDSTFKEIKKVKNTVKQKTPVNIIFYLLLTLGILAAGYFLFKYLYPIIKSKFFI
jgi:hypothetical protein